MDKFEKILDIIDHQEKYTDDEIREILRDEECRKLYQTMQEVDSALLKQSLENEKPKTDDKSSHRLDVDEAWEKFSEKHQLDNAEVIPINPHSGENSRFSWHKIAASIAGFVLISGIAFAAIHTYIRKSQEPMPIAENMGKVVAGDSLESDAAKVDSASVVKTKKPAIHKTFENVSFENMMAEIAAYYDLQVVFENEEAKKLRLYYEWDSHTEIGTVIRELNQFENVDISLHGKEIMIQ